MASRRSDRRKDSSLGDDDNGTSENAHAASRRLKRINAKIWLCPKSDLIVFLYYYGRSKSSVLSERSEIMELMAARFRTVLKSGRVRFALTSIGASSRFVQKKQNKHHNITASLSPWRSPRLLYSIF